MKNIKTFKQIFENSYADKSLKIASFGKDDHEQFGDYCDKISMRWEPLRSGEYQYKKHADEFGKFYIINDRFVVQCEGVTPNTIRIIRGSDDNNRFYSADRINLLKNKILDEIECSEPILNMSLYLSNKISPFIINPEQDIISGNEIDILSGYFKKYPLEIYKIKDEDLKKKILLTSGIKDYGRIGKKLSDGFI